MALSPDGRSLAFVASEPGGPRKLWIRDLQRIESRRLAGTEGAAFPFWSADSKSLGFFAGEKLKTVAVSGGDVRILAAAARGRGGAWNREGIIVFSPDLYAPLSRVSALGGAPAPVTRFDRTTEENSHRWPAFLPDGRNFLYIALNVDKGYLAGALAYLGSLDRLEGVPLRKTASRVAYSPPGYILFGLDKTLLAQPFDTASLKLSGRPLPLGRDLQFSELKGVVNFSVSETGILAHQAGLFGLSQPAWFNREGERAELVGEALRSRSPRLSRDGKRVVFIVDDREGGTEIRWYEDASRALHRLASETDEVYAPVWSPDGSYVVYSRIQNGQAELVRRSRAGEDTAIFFSVDVSRRPTASDWSRSGEVLAFHALDSAWGWDIWTVPGRGGTLTPFAQTDANEYDAQFSPDAQWVAYVSEESGKPEVYMQHYPSLGGRRQISRGGGTHPRWRRDGREVFYLRGRTVMAVGLETAPKVRIGAPQALFEARIRTVAGPEPGPYDVSPDGQRFLVNLDVGDDSSMPITIHREWRTGLPGWPAERSVHPADSRH